MDKQPKPDSADTTSYPPIGASLLIRVLDEIDYGMLLADARGRLRYANQMALTEVLCDGPLCLSGGRVRGRTDGDDALLHAAMSDAIRGRRRLVELGSVGSVMPLAVLPMAGEPGVPEPLALLVFGKRRHCEALTVDFYARTRGLTATEAGVLSDLCRGAKPKEIARERGVAISTVRTHICSIRQKTQTRSIRDLVHRVTALPPITSAIKAPASRLDAAEGPDTSLPPLEG